MKAKEYAKKLIENPDTLSEILQSFLDETIAIIEQRKATSSSAVFAVLREQNDKWRAFSDRTGIKKEGYKMLIQETLPFIYYLWQKNRK